MDSCILSFLNIGLAFFFTVNYFCAYGIVSHTYRLPLSCFLVKDLEALFGLMPEVLLRLPVPEIWILLFFVPVCIVCFLQTEKGE
ncbi:uncharacterized protein LOC126475357 [Schistocerca serialis cubense]|uniref:uncharacterized protein LOC126475357 n=1 Tax=Schistocerca serialis cubense TaxID=2023355 RepID=UPI00214F5CBA|nr:uncharacterized protein LOC126475357 [Schistocerca serialis cubense]